MSKIEIRPRFRHLCFDKPEEILVRLEKAIKDEKHPVVGYRAENHVVLKVPEEEAHYWSPQLSLHIEEDPKGTLVRGLFGPNPTIWLMFIFFYAILGFIALIVAIIGFSEVNLGLPGRILWLLPVIFLIVTLMYLSARFGQRKGRSQMEWLHHVLTDSVNCPMELWQS